MIDVLLNRIGELDSRVEKLSMTRDMSMPEYAITTDPPTDAVQNQYAINTEDGAPYYYRDPDWLPFGGPGGSAGIVFDVDPAPTNENQGGYLWVSATDYVQIDAAGFLGIYGDEMQFGTNGNTSTEIRGGAVTVYGDTVTVNSPALTLEGDYIRIDNNSFPNGSLVLENKVGSWISDNDLTLHADKTLMLEGGFYLGGGGGSLKIESAGPGVVTLVTLASTDSIIIDAYDQLFLRCGTNLDIDIGVLGNPVFSISANGAPVLIIDVANNEYHMKTGASWVADL
jgi:hypothetical protein